MYLNSASFLFAFLPVLLIAYHCIRSDRWKNILLIAASLLFYACGDGKRLWLLLAVAAVHWIVGVGLRRLHRGRGWLLAVTVAADAVLLFGCKLAGNLPLGISFYLFQAISYAVEVYRDGENCGSFREVLQYLTFFPQILSGPLARFPAVRPYLSARETSWRQTAKCLRRFTVGLAKKMLLAAPLAEIADAVFALEASAVDARTAWLGAAAYALQIFFDFSAYSDMAIAVGGMVGYPLPENFDFPYLAGSISGFWRRWHMSLSTWFRDYVYIPLGGNRKGKACTAVNKLIVFLVTGLWHGVSGTFVVWGLWHGALSVLETVTPLKKAEKHWYGHVYALLAVILGFVVFRAASLTQAWSMIGAMFGGFAAKEGSTQLLSHLLTARTVAVLAAGVLFSLPVERRVGAWLSGKQYGEAVGYVLTILLLALCVMAMAAGSFRPFIYAQF